MERRTVSFDVHIPNVEHTEEELEDWLRYKFGDNGCLSLSNPFSDYHPAPIFGTFCCDD